MHSHARLRACKTHLCSGNLLHPLLSCGLCVSLEAEECRHHTVFIQHNHTEGAWLCRVHHQQADLVGLMGGGGEEGRDSIFITTQKNDQNVYCEEWTSAVYATCVYISIIFIY